MIVFVYGTLRKGGCYHRIIENSEFIGNVAVEGEMFSLGRFPGAHFTPGKGKIQGELYKVDKATLSRLDNLEGYNERRPETSMYVRRKVSIMGSSMEAWAYEYRTEGAKFVRIPSGDWLDYHGKEISA